MNPDSTKQSFEIRVYPDVDVIRYLESYSKMCGWNTKILWKVIIKFETCYRAGGVEVRGLHATPISRRIPLGVPVLEKNEFIANFGKSKMKVHIYSTSVI